MSKYTLGQALLFVLLMCIGGIITFFAPFSGGAVLCIGLAGFTLTVHRHQRSITKQNLQELGMISAGLAHELKNPLSFVKNFAAINKELCEEALSACKKNEQHEVSELLVQLIENHAHLLNHTQRAEHTLFSILQLASQKKEKQATDINELVEEYFRYAYHALRAQHPEFNVSLDQQFSEELPKITINPGNMGRVFLNLISNGIYAACTFREPGEAFIRIQTALEGNTVRITIEDNGPGIDTNRLDEIMQPFYTTKPQGEGTGLGLSICKKIIKEHSGQLIFESQPEQYTKVTVMLPVGAA